MSYGAWLYGETIEFGIETFECWIVVASLNNDKDINSQLQVK